MSSSPPTSFPGFTPEKFLFKFKYYEYFWQYLPSFKQFNFAQMVLHKCLCTKKTCLLSLNTTSYTKSMHSILNRPFVHICVDLCFYPFVSICRRLKITFRSRIVSALLNKKYCRSSFVSNIIVITLKGSDVFGGCRDIKGIIYPFAHTVLFKCRLRFTNNAKIYSLLKVYRIL